MGRRAPFRKGAGRTRATKLTLRHTRHPLTLRRQGWFQYGMDRNTLTPSPDEHPAGAAAPRRELTPAARRALAEAEARRAARDAEAQAPTKEIAGRDGPEPVRYGDWEVNGIASDF